MLRMPDRGSRSATRKYPVGSGAKDSISESEQFDAMRWLPGQQQIRRRVASELG
jgi:hypothetical protein